MSSKLSLYMDVELEPVETAASTQPAPAPQRLAKEAPAAAVKAEAPRTSRSRFLEPERAFGNPTTEDRAGIVTPRMDVGETDEAVVFMIELPGTNEADIDVAITRDTLTVRGERRGDNCPAMKAWHYRECSYGRFERVTLIPDGIDPDDVTSRFRDGVLTVRIAKLARPRKARKSELAS